MKKIQFCCIAMAGLFLSGCSQMFKQPPGYYDYDYYDKYGHHYNPNATSESMVNENVKSKRRGHKPRPYSVTPEDQAKYESLNNRIKVNAQKTKGDVVVKTAKEASNDLKTSADASSSSLPGQLQSTQESPKSGATP